MIEGEEGVEVLDWAGVNLLDLKFVDEKRGKVCCGYKCADCTARSPTKFNFADCVDCNDEEWCRFWGRMERVTLKSISIST